MLHSFTNGSDGAYPVAGLIFDAAGNLYGTTGGGGASGCGTVFKLTPNADGSWTESVLHSFNGSDGAYPRPASSSMRPEISTARPVGAALHGYGTVFKLTPKPDGSWTESVLHSFNRSDGAVSRCRPHLRCGRKSLRHDLRGRLLVDGHGFQADAERRTEAGRRACCIASRQNRHSSPFAGLIFDAAGNLYGTTYRGGSVNDGAVFKLSPNQNGSWAYRLLHVFQGTPARIRMVASSSAALAPCYGTTESCTIGCQGVVYQITP